MNDVCLAASSLAMSVIVTVWPMKSERSRRARIARGSAIALPAIAELEAATPSEAICAAPRSGIVKKRMRDGIHILVSVIAVLLLLKPFDCFRSGQFTRKAADCCKKGKCVPSSNGDDCCKGTLPGGNQLLTPKAPDHSTPTLELITRAAPGPVAPAFAATAFTDVEAPPGSPPSSRLNRPLLI